MWKQKPSKCPLTLDGCCFMFKYTFFNITSLLRPVYWFYAIWKSLVHLLQPLSVIATYLRENSGQTHICHHSLLMGSYHFYNNSLAIARILLCQLTRIYLTMGLLSYLLAIFTVLFSLLPSDCYSIAGDFHRAIFVIYLVIVTERFSQYYTTFWAERGHQVNWETL